MFEDRSREELGVETGTRMPKSNAKAVTVNRMMGQRTGIVLNASVDDASQSRPRGGQGQGREGGATSAARGSAFCAKRLLSLSEMEVKHRQRESRREGVVWA